MKKRFVAVCVAVILGWWCLPISADALSVSSRSAVLYEPQSGCILYEKDADVRRPMASTTKLMTALVAAEKLSADTEVVIPETAVLVEGSSMGLRGGDHITVGDLLTGLLLSSGNDAANALAMLSCGSLEAFAEKMNRKAASLGMTNTVYVTPSGLDAGEHGSTARDMALLGAAVLKNPLLRQICKRKTAVIHLGNPMREATLSNHNRLLSLYPYAIGLKTGYTVKSGKCLISAAQKDGVTLIVATLNGGDYWNDHIRLYEYGFSQVKAVNLPAFEKKSVPVAGGESSLVTLQAETPPPAVLRNEEENAVAMTVELPRFIWAPVAAGERVGTVRYTANGRSLYELPITAVTAVPERPALSFKEKFKRSLTALIKEFIG